MRMLSEVRRNDAREGVAPLLRTVGQIEPACDDWQQQSVVESSCSMQFLKDNFDRTCTWIHSHGIRTQFFTSLVGIPPSVEILPFMSSPGIEDETVSTLLAFRALNMQTLIKFTRMHKSSGTSVQYTSVLNICSDQINLIAVSSKITASHRDRCALTGDSDERQNKLTH